MGEKWDLGNSVLILIQAIFLEIRFLNSFGAEYLNHEAQPSFAQPSSAHNRKQKNKHATQTNHDKERQTGKGQNLWLVVLVRFWF